MEDKRITADELQAGLQADVKALAEKMAEAINNASIPATQTLSGLASLGLSPEQSLAYINRLIDQQAFMLSANDIFAASSALFLILIGVIWLARPVPLTQSVDTGGAH